jgi:N-acetylmuramoyl-L-alanine amidase
MQQVNVEDLLIAARTVFGEARGESQDGKQAVANVLVNRWRKQTGQFAKDDTLATTCLRHLQFSAWNQGDPNFDTIQEIGLGSKLFRACFKAVLDAIDGNDLTKGALHYHTKQISPAWAAGHEPCLDLGNHLFYNTVE